jgi:hypothetical protein
MKKSKLISSEILSEVKITTARGDILNVRLEQNNYDNAPYVDFIGSINAPAMESGYRQVFMVYNEGLAQLFIKEYIKLQEGK